MEPINTQVVDLSLIALALILGGFSAFNYTKKQRTSVKAFPMFLVWTAGLWCLLNWIGHILAVFYVSSQAIMDGSFTYSYYFYSLIFMGIVFFLLSLLQLRIISKMSQKGIGPYKHLKWVSAMIILLSLPIIPLNPLGSLPVISSIIILTTVAITKKSWFLADKPDDIPFIPRKVA